MLTGDLIQVKIDKKRLHPRLVDPDAPELQELAADVLDVFHEARASGGTRGEITTALQEMGAERVDHKLLRGLGKVLLDRCDFETVAPLDPVELRAHVFQHAAVTGPLHRHAGPLGHRTARDVFEDVARELDTTAEAVAAALYADLKDEQTLVKYTGPEESSPDAPAELLHRYNVELVRALLLRATQLTLKLAEPEPARLRQLFRYIKFFQLMYRARLARDPSTGAVQGVILELDGPQSLLVKSTKYGMNLATFFPAVLLQPTPWRIEAEVLWGRKRKLRKELVLNHTLGLRSHYRDRGGWTPQAVTWFRERWDELDTRGWTVHPGELVDLGNQEPLVPDLSFRHEETGRVGHLDVVGYWRKAWLRKRLEHTPPEVILAVSKKLAGEKGALPKTVQGQVVLFSEIISAPKVLERLEALPVSAPASR